MPCDPAATRGKLGLRKPPPHRDRGDEREQREDTDRDAPADDCARERHAQSSDEAAGDERRHVVPHGACPDPRHERLDDVGGPDRQQPRHAEPLNRAADEEGLETGRESNADRGRHEQ